MDENAPTPLTKGIRARYRSNLEAAKALLKEDLIDDDEYKEEKKAYRVTFLEELTARSKAKAAQETDSKIECDVDEVSAPAELSCAC